VGVRPRSTVTFDGHVQVAATSGTTVYVGGEFTHATDLGGNVVTRGRLAALDARTGALLSWNPRANKAVYAIAVDAAHGTVYVGGDFSTVGSATRHRLAAVDAVSGAWTRPGGRPPPTACTRSRCRRRATGSMWAAASRP